MAYKNIEDRIKYDKEYYLKNKEKKQKQRRILYLKNRDEILKTKKENYIPHPKILKTDLEKKASRKLWVDENRKIINTLARKWNKKHKERVSEYKREYYRTRLSIHTRYIRLKASAKRKNATYDVKISEQEFENIVNKPCMYCGEREERRGIDRIDNSVGYTLENSAPCCKICNRMKMSMSVDEFLNHIKKIYLHK